MAVVHWHGDCKRMDESDVGSKHEDACDGDDEDVLHLQHYSNPHS